MRTNIDWWKVLGLVLCIVSGVITIGPAFVAGDYIASQLPPDTSSYEDDLDTSETWSETDVGQRLIGIGCKGSSVPLYADEEDMFPYPCKDIHANNG